MFHGLQKEHYASWKDEQTQQELHDDCQFARQQYIKRNEFAWERINNWLLKTWRRICETLNLKGS